MFYSQLLLAKRGPLGRLWLAAHGMNKGLNKQAIATLDIRQAAESLRKPQTPLALRVSGHLLLGLSRIYARQVQYLFADSSDAYQKIKAAFRTGGGAGGKDTGDIDTPDAVEAGAADIDLPVAGGGHAGAGAGGGLDVNAMLADGAAAGSTLGLGLHNLLPMPGLQGPLDAVMAGAAFDFGAAGNMEEGGADWLPISQASARGGASGGLSSASRLLSGASGSGLRLDDSASRYGLGGGRRLDGADAVDEEDGDDVYQPLGLDARSSGGRSGGTGDRSSVSDIEIMRRAHGSSMGTGVGSSPRVRGALDGAGGGGDDEDERGSLYSDHDDSVRGPGAGAAAGAAGRNSLLPMLNQQAAGARAGGGSLLLPADFGGDALLDGEEAEMAALMLGTTTTDTGNTKYGGGAYGGGDDGGIGGGYDDEEEVPQDGDYGIGGDDGGMHGDESGGLPLGTPGKLGARALSLTQDEGDRLVTEDDLAAALASGSGAAAAAKKAAAKAAAATGKEKGDQQQQGQGAVSAAAAAAEKRRAERRAKLTTTGTGGGGGPLASSSHLVDAAIAVDSKLYQGWLKDDRPITGSMRSAVAAAAAAHAATGIGRLVGPVDALMVHATGNAVRRAAAAAKSEADAASGTGKKGGAAAGDHDDTSGLASRLEASLVLHAPPHAAAAATGVGSSDGGLVSLPLAAGPLPLVSPLVLEAAFLTATRAGATGVGHPHPRIAGFLAAAAAGGITYPRAAAAEEEEEAASSAARSRKQGAKQQQQQGEEEEEEEEVPLDGDYGIGGDDGGIGGGYDDLPLASDLPLADDGGLVNHDALDEEGRLIADGGSVRSGSSAGTGAGPLAAGLDRLSGAGGRVSLMPSGGLQAVVAAAAASDAGSVASSGQRSLGGGSLVSGIGGASLPGSGASAIGGGEEEEEGAAGGGGGGGDVASAFQMEGKWHDQTKALLRLLADEMTSPKTITGTGASPPGATHVGGRKRKASEMSTEGGGGGAYDLTVIDTGKGSPSDPLSFLDLAVGSTRRAAAVSFFHLLVLRSWGVIDMAQPEPYGDIAISRTRAFAKALADVLAGKHD